MALIKNGSTFARPFVLYLAGTKTPATGKTPAAQLSKAGGTLVSLSGSIVENAGGAGWYTANYNSTDTNTNGVLGLHVTAAGCDPVDEPDRDQVFPGTLLTGGTGADQISAAGGAVDLKASSIYALALVPFVGTVSQASGPPTVSDFEISSLPAYNDQSFRDYVVLAASGPVAGEFHRIKTWDHLTKRAGFVTPWTQVLPAGTQLNLMPWGGADYLAADSLARLLGLGGDLMVEDDVVMDPNGSGFRVSWNYYLYDTEAHRAAHLLQQPNATRTGLVYKYAALRHIAAGIVVDFTMTRVL